MIYRITSWSIIIITIIIIIIIIKNKKKGDKYIHLA